MKSQYCLYKVGITYTLYSTSHVSCKYKVWLFVSTQKSESSDAVGNKILSLKVHHVLFLKSALSELPLK